MKAGVLLFVVSDVKDYLVGKGVLAPDGEFTFHGLAEELGLVSVIENSLKAHGVEVQSDVDRILQALPLLLAVLGIK